MNRDDLLIWLSLVLVCHPLRCGDLGDISAMTEDISQDHPDHMRIVISLNTERYPDCDAYGFDHKPRVGISRNILCKACDQGFNVRRTRRKCISCSELAAGRPREPRLSRGERFGRQRRPPLVMNGRW